MSNLSAKDKEKGSFSVQRYREHSHLVRGKSGEEGNKIKSFIFMNARNEKDGKPFLPYTMASYNKWKKSNSKYLKDKTKLNKESAAKRAAKTVSNNEEKKRLTAKEKNGTITERQKLILAKLRGKK